MVTRSGRRHSPARAPAGRITKPAPRRGRPRHAGAAAAPPTPPPPPPHVHHDPPHAPRRRRRGRACGCTPPTRRTPAATTPAAFVSAPVLAGAGLSAADRAAALTAGWVAIAAADGRFAALFAAAPGGGSARPPHARRPVFDALVRAVVYQQLAGAAADAIWRRLQVALLVGADAAAAGGGGGGGHAGGGCDGSAAATAAAATAAGVVAPPTPVERAVTPADVARLSEADLRSAGLSRQKASYIAGAAAAFSAAASTWTESSWDALDDEAVLNRLASLRGVGRWTAGAVAMVALQRADILLTGDLGLRRGAAAVWGGGRGGLLSDEALEAVFERFRPYRSFAAWMLWRVKGGG
ncbi:hypothetical protein BU14_0880s0004 [Porphyra umbilicalis]|uniref:HhH-GPD domain-containing protein n=1 Tax=Porphyra umbilicalis TaxID=2786 RepID=A0A1X6NNQ1_PORUM|nr:hypothetical protein BU14_0880s0004 [Porphyra umbilicalis]|eukprot:OSX70160.1 hypothetical protein BU14_0880s0004 [Porphyra umbilicalis]